MSHLYRILKFCCEPWIFLSLQVYWYGVFLCVPRTHHDFTSFSCGIPWRNINFHCDPYHFWKAECPLLGQRIIARFFQTQSHASHPHLTNHIRFFLRLQLCYQCGWFVNRNSLAIVSHFCTPAWCNHDQFIIFYFSRNTLKKGWESATLVSFHATHSSSYNFSQVCNGDHICYLSCLNIC